MYVVSAANKQGQGKNRSIQTRSHRKNITLQRKFTQVLKNKIVLFPFFSSLSAAAKEFSTYIQKTETDTSAAVVDTDNNSKSTYEKWPLNPFKHFFYIQSKGDKTLIHFNFMLCRCYTQKQVFYFLNCTKDEHWLDWNCKMSVISVLSCETCTLHFHVPCITTTARWTMINYYLQKNHHNTKY